MKVQFTLLKLFTSFIAIQTEVLFNTDYMFKKKCFSDDIFK